MLLNSLLMHEWNDDVNSIPTRRNSIKTPYQKSIIILRFRMRLSPIVDVDNRHHYDCLRMRVCISHKMRWTYVKINASYTESQSHYASSSEHNSMVRSKVWTMFRICWWLHWNNQIITKSNRINKHRKRVSHY